jgi:hypothetical protein
MQLQTHKSHKHSSDFINYQIILIAVTISHKKRFLNLPSLFYTSRSKRQSEASPLKKPFTCGNEY